MEDKERGRNTHGRSMVKECNSKGTRMTQNEIVVGHTWNKSNKNVTRISHEWNNNGTGMEQEWDNN